jgi:hypothetical protein
LQLNTYKTIIEEKYGKKVVGLCLVCMHPNNSDYQLIEVPFMEKEMVDLFEYRKQILAKAKTKTSAKKSSDDKAADKPADKPISSYFKPSTKKGSGLLLNLNSI